METVLNNYYISGHIWTLICEVLNHKDMYSLIRVRKSFEKIITSSDTYLQRKIIYANTRSMSYSIIDMQIISCKRLSYGVIKTMATHKCNKVIALYVTLRNICLLEYIYMARILRESDTEDFLVSCYLDIFGNEKLDDLKESIEFIDEICSGDLSARVRIFLRIIMKGIMPIEFMINGKEKKLYKALHWNY